MMFMGKIQFVFSQAANRLPVLLNDIAGAQASYFVNGEN